MFHLSNIALIFVVFLTLGVLYAYAETPSPYDEWDFDIVSEKFTVVQSHKNLERMNISVPIIYNGEFPAGTTHVYVVVTDPLGRDHNLFGQTRDLKIGQTQVMEFEYLMTEDGIYVVDVSLKSPSELHQNWPFDHDAKTLEIEPDELLEKLGTRGDESGLITSYFLANPSEIQYDEVVHAKISLPEDHNFEKIALVNGKFVKEYGTNVKDIYIDGNYNYGDMKVKLVQYGNLLPMADAQETLQEYVVFYSYDKELCTQVFCINIDPADDPEFPLWLLLFTGVIPVAYYIIKTRPRPYVSDPTKYVNSKRSTRDEKEEYETKDYIDNVGNPLKLFSLS